jgi:hypothetical protein
LAARGGVSELSDQAILGEVQTKEQRLAEAGHIRKPAMIWCIGRL